MRTLHIKVSRFDPEKDRAPRFVPYTVRVHEGARVLHALHAVHDGIDPTLSYRHSCGAGQCGSCAVMVNKVPVLACTAEAEEGMVVEPLRLPVKKDLVVEIEPFIASISSLAPNGKRMFPERRQIEPIKELRSCVNCLCCVSACPVMDVAKFAGPAVMRDMRRLALDPRDGKDRVGEAIEKGLFACTACQACKEVCPKHIGIPAKAIEKLRASAVSRGFTIPKHRQFARSVKETWRIVPATVSITLLEHVPEVIEPEGKVKLNAALFTGCSYSMVMPGTGFDAIEVMRRNGIRLTIPRGQVCCGSPLIRTGQLDLIPTLKARNTEALTRCGADVVVTICAGCGSTLKNDYRIPLPVMDMTEVLTKYGIEPPPRLPFTVTYHDPCHLLRGQGIKDEPRQLIAQVAQLVEMTPSCCGAGGGVRAGFPDEAAALGERRRNEIAGTGADMVVSACPFCEFHLRQHTDKPVRNIASLLLDAYRAKEDPLWLELLG